MIVIRLTISENIIGPNTHSPERRDVAHGPINRAVKRCIGLVPGANLNARTAAGTLLIANAHGCAFFNVVVPFLIAVVHDFIPMTYCLGGTRLGTFAAFVAKILQAEVNGFVHGQWYP